MEFNKAYEYLIENLDNKEITIKELNQTVSNTEYFDIIDGYFLSDCIISKNNCSFNSYENEDITKVINVDIVFLDNKDFKIIKSMSWKNDYEYENIKVLIKNIEYYDL
jgi:hypothetical protein